jgi:hypothetical protein
MLFVDKVVYPGLFGKKDLLGVRGSYSYESHILAFGAHIQPDMAIITFPHGGQTLVGGVRINGFKRIEPNRVYQFIGAFWALWQWFFNLWFE